MPNFFERFWNMESNNLKFTVELKAFLQPSVTRVTRSTMHQLYSNKSERLRNWFYCLSIFLRQVAFESGLLRSSDHRVLIIHFCTISFTQMKSNMSWGKSVQKWNMYLKTSVNTFKKVNFSISNLVNFRQSKFDVMSQSKGQLHLFCVCVGILPKLIYWYCFIIFYHIFVFVYRVILPLLCSHYSL